MTVSLRLDSSLDRELSKHAQLEGRSKSDLIRSLISDFVAARSVRRTPWDIGKDLFGQEGSGHGTLSVNRKAVLKEKLRAKKDRH